MEPSIQKIAGRWYWFDEVWNRNPTAYSTREQAVTAQNLYIDVVLEGRVRTWKPGVGDFVWWGALVGREPARIVRKGISRSEWVVRLLISDQLFSTLSDYLTPMAEMELLALCADDPEIKL